MKWFMAQHNVEMDYDTDDEEAFHRAMNELVQKRSVQEEAIRKDNEKGEKQKKTSGEEEKNQRDDRREINS